MPKLKKVKVEKDSMSWNDVVANVRNDCVLVTIPRREFLQFKNKGRKIKKMLIEFD